jgi:hypothetical protein
MGDDNVYVGPEPVPPMGDRNTIWTAADAAGNIVIPGGTAVGAGAHADSTSVAVGSGAGAGDSLMLLEMLERLQVTVANDPTAMQVVTELSAAVQAPTVDRTRIKKVWAGVQSAITLGDGAALVAQIAPALAHLL